MFPEVHTPDNSTRPNSRSFQFTYRRDHPLTGRQSHHVTDRPPVAKQLKVQARVTYSPVYKIENVGNYR